MTYTLTMPEMMQVHYDTPSKVSTEPLAEMVANPCG